MIALIDCNFLASIKNALKNFEGAANLLATCKNSRQDIKLYKVRRIDENITSD